MTRSRFRRSSFFRSLLVLAMIVIICGCSEPSERTNTVRVIGSIALPDDLSAEARTNEAPAESVTVNLYHAWAKEGRLLHPLEFITSFKTAPGEFSHEFKYPIELGKGLVVYAWHDADGDGVHCTPDVHNDYAGLLEIEAFPAAEVAADLQLTEPCAGPDWFYPTAPFDE